MTIREIAAKTNMSTDTLRYYERIGLLPVSYTHLTLPTTSRV